MQIELLFSNTGPARSENVSEPQIFIPILTNAKKMTVTNVYLTYCPAEDNGFDFSIIL